MNRAFREGLEIAGLALDELTCQQLELFLDELLRWNCRVNLTSITDRALAAEKHLLDSLLLLPLLGDSVRMLDMGSGAGLPGIPLQIARPELEVVSVDSVGKKVNFQRHIKRLLGLKKLQPVQSRLEDLNTSLPSDQKFDLITARAFASLEVIVRLASPWLSPGGRVLAMKGPEGEREICGRKGLLAEEGLRVAEVHKFCLPLSSAERQVLVLE